MRGTFAFDRHSTRFSDLKRRCTVAIDAVRDSEAWRQMDDLSVTSPARVDATLTGRLLWRDESPGWRLPKGYWVLEVASVADVVVTERSLDAMFADIEKWPKVIGLEPVRD